MSKVSFEDIGAVIATFAVQEGVKGGQVVKVTGQGQVGPCSNGDLFCGVALEPRQSFGAVQVKGFAAVKASGTLAPGWAELTADGQGGVRAVGDKEAGIQVLVVSVETDGSATLCL